MARKYKENVIAATPPDQTAEFDHEGRTIQVSFWHDLVPSDTKVADATHTFSLYAFSDPHYIDPLILATDLDLMPETVFLIYLDRWLVEQPPLAAKQMIGLHRCFVSAPEACFRLPELALLAGAILSYVAAVSPPIPTGFDVSAVVGVSLGEASVLHVSGRMDVRITSTSVSPSRPVSRCRP